MLGFMPFLPVVDLLITSQMTGDQLQTVSIEEVPPIEKVLPVEPTQQVLPLESIEEDVLLDTSLEVKPFVLEGSVDNFDPIARAVKLSKTIPRKLCGEFRPFGVDKKIAVELSFLTVKPMGQIVYLSGEMFLDSMKTKFQGNLNAKSDQLELLPSFKESLMGLDPGGFFIGLQGVDLTGWQSSVLDIKGGRLKLTDQCDQQLSKSPSVIAIW